MRGIIILSALIAVASGYKVSEEYHAHPPGYGAPPPPPVYQPTPAPPSYEPPTPAPAYDTPAYDEPEYQGEYVQEYYSDQAPGPKPYSQHPQFQNFYYEDENRVVTPSMSLKNGYIPREIVQFRETFIALRRRYPNLPLLAPEDLGYNPKANGGRDAKIFGPGFPFVGWLPFAFGVGGAAGGGGGGNETAEETPASTPSNMLPQCYDYPGVCRNGDGLCQTEERCLKNGGKPIGRCSYMQNNNVCCQYNFSQESTTDAAISFLTSPGFPNPVRAAESYTLSLKVRSDVDQVLVEFVNFELAVGPTGCSQLEYVEIIAPSYAGGLLGPGNSKLCGMNTDQHLYMDVKPGDTIIFKVVLAGLVVKFDELPPTVKNKYMYHYRSDDSRFKLKITQLMSPVIYEENVQMYYYKNIARPGLISYECIPDYYLKLRRPKNCLQYYADFRGTFMNFNFDGKTCMPPDLDYKICFAHPDKFCGISLSALEFDIPTIAPKCMDGHDVVDGLYPCCTGANKRTGEVLPGYVQKYVGLDGYSDGNTKGISYVHNQMRYFFCGSNLGRTNYVVSEARGPMVVQVYSDSTPCTLCDGYKNHGVGFKIKYNINLGHC